MALPFEIPAWLTLKMVGIISVIVLIIGIYFYVGYLRSTIQTLEANNATLKSAVKTQQETIHTLQDNFQSIQNAFNEYFEKYKELQTHAADLENDLYREKYGKKSIEELILAGKVKLVQAIINSASNRTLRCFEEISGKVSDKPVCK